MSERTERRMYCDYCYGPIAWAIVDSYGDGTYVSYVCDRHYGVGLA